MCPLDIENHVTGRDDCCELLGRDHPRAGAVITEADADGRIIVARTEYGNSVKANRFAGDDQAGEPASLSR